MSANLAAAGYRKVPSVKNDPRLVPCWQRWEGPGGEMDWFEFPHDMPLELVWSIIDLNAGLAKPGDPA